MKRILEILLFFLACTCTVQARNYIVCVGINDYPSGPDLHVSVNDAYTIEEIFRKNGSSQTKIIVGRQATCSNVCSTLLSVFSNATSSDAIIFFFSGHGVPGGFVCYDGILSYRIIINAMKRSRARKKMVFADTCYSGKMRKSKRHDNNPSSESVMFFLSSRTNEMSIEKQGMKNSLFTYYLSASLRGKADTNLDRIISAKEAYDFVHSGVIKSSGNRQHPVMWGKFNNNMSIINW